jgi:hypothetical protein
LKIIDFRRGDLGRFGPIPPLPYPCDRIPAGDGEWILKGWLQRRLDNLPKRRGRRGQYTTVLGPWLERACIEFGADARSICRGNLITNPLGLALVRYHLPYVQSVAWRVWSRRHPKKREHTLEFADLVSAGLEGLVQAIREWKPGHGGLNAFARKRISGAIYNALYNELHPRGTRRFTRPVAHQSYSDWMCGETPADPIELYGQPVLKQVPDYCVPKPSRGSLIVNLRAERKQMWVMRYMGRRAYADCLIARKSPAHRL